VIAPKGSPLGGLARLRSVRSKRFSSWDRSGGNDDRLHLRPGETTTLAHIAGAGSIVHIWVTIASEHSEPEPHYLRKLVLRAYWDGEQAPSIEAPIGDFFGVGHAQTVNYTALPMQMSPQDGRGFNCWFPMPFAAGAHVEIHSDCEREILFYFYIDCELYDDAAAVDGQGRFHAQWRRERATAGIGEAGLTQREWLFEGANIGGQGNYVLLEAEGRGHYVGCNLNIHNLRETSEWNWYGEGDDMIFVDGEEWPPSLHGTGTEDYFNTSWCPSEAYSAPYHGITMPGGPNWSGKISLYRFHIEDPVYFSTSIRVTIEHGHANRRSDDLSSTAYWYQSEPHTPFPPLPAVELRLPRDAGDEGAA